MRWVLVVLFFALLIMKISAELDGFETEALFDILQHEIIKHREESKLSFLLKEIDLPRHKWNLGHAAFLEGIKTKLLTHHEKTANL